MSKSNLTPDYLKEVAEKIGNVALKKGRKEIVELANWIWTEGTKLEEASIPLWRS